MSTNSSAIQTPAVSRPATTGNGKNPRRRSQAERRETARQKILDAAIDCFNQQGYHASSMADIARQAGVSKGLLHYHFENKENIGLAVEARMAERLFNGIVETSAPLTPSVGQALVALDKLFSDLVDAREFVPIVVDLASRALTDPASKQRFMVIIESHVDLLKLAVSRILGPIADEVEMDDQVLADTLLVMFGGLAIGNVFIDDPKRLDNLFALFKKMLILHVIPDRLKNQVQ